MSSVEEIRRYEGSIEDIPVHIREETNLGWPTTDELRDRLKSSIHLAMTDERNVLIRAPTATGKTENGAGTPWKELEVTGGEPVVHLHPTIKARDEAVKKSKEAGVTYHVLLGREEACDTAAGIFDDSDEIDTPDGSPPSHWIKHQCGIGAGTTLSTAHNMLETYNGGTLPCSPCPVKTQYEGIPRDDEGEPTVDVIHATHPFAYVPSLIHETNVIIDEQPDFGVEVSQEGAYTQQRIQDMVAAWLTKIGAVTTNWERFVVFARDGVEGLARSLKSDHDVDPEWFVENDDAHVLAPAITEAVFDALSQSPDRNGRFSAMAHNDMSQFEERGVVDPRYSRTRVTVVIDEKNRLQKFWNVPELGNARSLICLDAWPSIPEFDQNVGTELTMMELMNHDKLNRWRRFERGLEVVQIGDAARPAGSKFAAENYFNPEQVQVVIEWLRTIFEDEFRSVIAPKRVEERVQDMMSEAGIEDPDAWTMHQGEEKSRGEFSREMVGFVTNCIDPGDDYVIDLLSARGLDARPETVVCNECSGNGCRDCDESGERRAMGRGFTGPDSKIAAQILDGLRANRNNQCVGRYARHPDDKDIRSLVFVRSNTVDESLVDLTVPDPWVFGKKQRVAVDYLRDHPEATLKQTKDAIDDQFKGGVTKASVRDTFEKLRRYGVAERSLRTGPRRADQYRLTSPVPEHGLVKLPELNRRKPLNQP